MSMMSLLYNYTLGPICKKGSDPTENWALDAIVVKFPKRLCGTVSKALKKSSTVRSIRMFLSLAERRSWRVNSSCVSQEKILKLSWKVNRMLCWSKCCPIWNVIIWSIILQQKHVRETGQAVVLHQISGALREDKSHICIFSSQKLYNPLLMIV